MDKACSNCAFYDALRKRPCNYWNRDTAPYNVCRAYKEKEEE